MTAPPTLTEADLEGFRLRVLANDRLMDGNGRPNGSALYIEAMRWYDDARAKLGLPRLLNRHDAPDTIAPDPHLAVTALGRDGQDAAVQAEESTP